MANIIIDVDVKYTEVVPNNSVSTSCPPSGCSLNWVDLDRYWVSIKAPSPSVNYMPFSIWMLPSSTTEEKKHIIVKEANSASELPGLCLTIGLNCGSGHGEDHMHLRREDGSSAGRVSFSEDENGNLVVRLAPELANQGYTLSRLVGIEESGGMNDGTTGMQSGSSDSKKVLFMEEQSTDRDNQSINAAPVIQVSPNPFSQNINVSVTASDTETVNIELLNANGQILRRQTYVGNQDKFPFQTQEVPLGCYFLRIQAGDRVYLHRVVKVE